MFRDKIIFGSWRAVTVAALPFFLLYVLWRVLRDPGYARNAAERFGILPGSFRRTAPGALWLHAVSAGEVISAAPLIRELRQALPGASVFVTTGTIAGRKAAEARLVGLADGICFAPFDLVPVVRRFIRTLRPAAVVILETEIWPNLFREVRRSNCALVVVNGRISDKTAASYRRHSWFFEAILRQPDAILVQSQEDARRYQDAGAPADRVTVAGNLKYDFDPSQTGISAAVEQWLSLSNRPLWIAASTVAPEFDGDVDEDDAVIRAWQQLPQTRLIVAPRKPERFDVAARKWAAAGIRIARRTTLPQDADAPVLLLDSIGELGGLFRTAQVVFMGGTLAKRGGHNILEPALCGKPVICGPSLENFADIAARFDKGRGLLRIQDPEQIAPTVGSLLEDAGAREQWGERARALAEAERGATSRAVDAILRCRWQNLPTMIPYPGTRLLARVWRWGGWLKRRRTESRSLATPVVSIGGIAMGGSGKTPVLRDVVRGLRELGMQPAVLTRGYGRRSREAVTLLRAGDHAPVAATGDEAQIILQDGVAHLAIGSDRYDAGRAAEAAFAPDVFVMDDGFQHAKLARELDIVVLDGLDPLAGGHIFPAGWQREPVEALQRCHAIVLSRADERSLSALKLQLPHNVPVFLGHTAPRYWRNLETGERSAVELFAGRDVVAFCGLGNPEAFRRSLLECGCRIAAFHAFPDHHWFTESEVHELVEAAGTAVLVTTEKDAVRLTPMKAFALGIDSAVPGLTTFIASRLKLPGSVTRR